MYSIIPTNITTFTPTCASTNSDIHREYQTITCHPNFSVLPYVHSVMLQNLNGGEEKSENLRIKRRFNTLCAGVKAYSFLTNLLLVLDAPNRSRPASSLTSSPASAGGRAELLQFLVGCILARVAKRRTNHPAYWSSSPHPTLRENSAPFGSTLNLPLPYPLMAAWCDVYSTVFFFLYSVDWVECLIGNLAKNFTRLVLV